MNRLPILIISKTDHKQIREFLEGHPGYSTHISDSVNKAISLCRNIKFSCLLVDIVDFNKKDIINKFGKDFGIIFLVEEEINSNFDLFEYQSKQSISLSLLEHKIKCAIEKSKLHKKLYTSQDTFYKLMDESPYPVMIYNGNNVSYANQSLLKWLKYTDINSIEDIHNLIHKEDFYMLNGTKENNGLLIRCITSDKKTVIGEINMLDLKVKNNEGAPSNVVVLKDVTEKKQLEQRVLQSERLASVGTLAAGVAHEINNPLAAMIANLEYLSGEFLEFAGASPSERLKNIEEVLKETQFAARKIHKIVQGLRNFSRVEEEKSVPVNVNSACNLAINMAANEIKHNATIIREYGNIPNILGDESKVTQILINLIVNAVQSFNTNNVALNEITIRTYSKNNDVIIDVVDCGSGISSEIIDKIFTPFFTTKPIGVGTGLGLSISHGLVKSIGGDIECFSLLGKGTTMRVTLPATNKPITSKILSAPKNIKPSKKENHVLILDDDLFIGKSLERIFKESYRVTVSQNGYDVISNIRNGENYDVIICDLMMPIISGMMFFNILKQSFPHLTDRVIFATGGIQTDEIERFVKETNNICLEKPFNLNKIKILIDEKIKKIKNAS